MQTTYNSDKRKLLSCLSHGSIFLSTLIFSAGIPLAILMISDDEVVKETAKEALNFHLNVWLYGLIVGLLCWVLIGWFLLPVLLVYHWTMPVLAILSSLKNPEQTYRYPFIFRAL
jgi:uncharacterized Tic20 family protein